MRIITWNLNSISKRYLQLMKLMHEEEPQIILIQETKTHMQFDFERYYSFYAPAEKGRNGVGILVQKRGVEYGKLITKELIPGRLLKLDTENASFYSAYVPQGGSESSNTEIKIDFLKRMYDFINEDTKPIKILGGDFNVATNLNEVSSKDFLSKIEECEAFLLYEKTTLCDAVKYYNLQSKYLTWWDYRELAFIRNIGMGIDRFLVTGVDVQDIRILRDFRRLKQPSDHAPVAIDLKKLQ